jgi:mono/diheme cytochrome c family protein
VKKLFPLLVLIAGCEANLPGKPDPAKRETRPDEIVDFAALYSRHCSGCHGKEGKLGPAPPLNDPLFLAITSYGDLSEVIRDGRPGTLMPAFERPRGPLTDRQIEALVKGLKEHWSGPKKELTGVPYYTRPRWAPPGDPGRGKAVFLRACARCHGGDGHGTRAAGAINDPAFLGLISDQALRRLIITGRPDLGMPDYAGTEGRATDYQPMRSSEVTDLMAFLARWRQSSGEEAKR